MGSGYILFLSIAAKMKAAAIMVPTQLLRYNVAAVAFGIAGFLLCGIPGPSGRPALQDLRSGEAVEPVLETSIVVMPDSKKPAGK